MTTPQEQIEELIASGVDVIEGECEVTEAEFSSPSHIYIGGQHIGSMYHDNGYGDDFADFIAKAANARPAIKAMHQQNIDLKQRIAFLEKQLEDKSYEH